MTIDSATLKLRYPAFASVADDTITYWLTDAGRIVDTSWFAADVEPAALALAAHNMAVTGALPKTGAAALPAGVTRFRSASMDVGLTEAAANASIHGGYQSTSYGQDFEPMLRRNRGGPRLVGGYRPCPGTPA